MSTPHNPDSLTPEQVGAPEWRLLDEDEIIASCDMPNHKVTCDAWLKHWVSGWGGGHKEKTYRTKLSRAKLREARGLPPEDPFSCRHCGQPEDKHPWTGCLNMDTEFEPHPECVEQSLSGGTKPVAKPPDTDQPVLAHYAGYPKSEHLLPASPLGARQGCDCLGCRIMREIDKVTPPPPKDGTHFLAIDEKSSFGFYDGKNVPRQTVVHWHQDGFYPSVHELEAMIPFSFTRWVSLDTLSGGVDIMLGDPTSGVRVSDEEAKERGWDYVPDHKEDKYVAGFMFNDSKTQVALIRKSKPEWQRGKLNGIGGKIEEGESPLRAMVREFKEESGMLHEGWKYFLKMRGTNSDGALFQVHFFHTSGDLLLLESMEEEKIEIINIGGISPLRDDMIENLPWLISFALDNAVDGRPSFATVTYVTPSEPEQPGIKKWLDALGVDLDDTATCCGPKPSRYAQKLESDPTLREKHEQGVKVFREAAEESEQPPPSKEALAKETRTELLKRFRPSWMHDDFDGSEMYAPILRVLTAHESAINAEWQRRYDALAEELKAVRGVLAQVIEERDAALAAKADAESEVSALVECFGMVKAVFEHFGEKCGSTPPMCMDDAAQVLLSRISNERDALRAELEAAKKQLAEVMQIAREAINVLEGK